LVEDWKEFLIEEQTLWTITMSKSI
jgi:hypothetical protein